MGAFGGIHDAPHGPVPFIGTDNPRHVRVIKALVRRALPREELDRVAGCSNGPDLVTELRRRGLEIPCPRTAKIDRDFRTCKPGVYYLTKTDRRKVLDWMGRACLP